MPLANVLTDGVRSAEPPINSGRTGASASSTLPLAARLAMPLASASNEGSASVQPSGSSPAMRRRSSAARSGADSA